MPLVKSNRTDFNHLDYTFEDIPATTLESGRTYHTPIGDLPSVTTVLGCDPAKQVMLEEWRERVGREEAERITKSSGKRGDEVHLLAESYVNNEPLEYKSDISKRMFLTIRPIIDKIDNIIAQEVPLYSKILGLAGRVDCIADFDGVRSIIDYKTSRKEKRKEWITDYFIQCSCYSYMFTEMTGENIEQIVVIIANENTPYGNVFIEKRDNYKKGLLERIQLYNKINNIKSVGFRK